MTPRLARSLLRAVHLFLGAVLALMACLPPAWTGGARLPLSLTASAIIVATGVGMWQQARLRRIWRPLRCDEPA